MDFKASSNLLGNISVGNKSVRCDLSMPLASLSEVGLCCSFATDLAQTTPSSALSAYTAKMRNRWPRKITRFEFCISQLSFLFWGCRTPFRTCVFLFGHAILDVIYGDDFVNAAMILTILGISQLLQLR